MNGRCDVSLAQNKYAIVKERQVCISTILPTKDFYYPGRRYEGIQFYIDRSVLKQSDGKNLLTWFGVNVEQMVEVFCGKNGLYERTKLRNLSENCYRRKQMVKAIKVMLIPNNVQKTKMFQYAGASRIVTHDKEVCEIADRVIYMGK